MVAKGKLNPQPVSVLGKNKSFPVKLPPSPPSLLEPAGMGRRGAGQACSPVSSAASQNPAFLLPNPIPTPFRSRQVKGLQTQEPEGQRAGSVVGFEGEKIPMVALGTECVRTRVQGRGWEKPLGYPWTEHHAIHLSHTPFPPASLFRASQIAGFRNLGEMGRAWSTQQNQHRTWCQREMAQILVHHKLT